LSSGYLYLLHHPATPGWLKVGHTYDTDRRLSNYQTGDPYRRYVYAATVWFDDRVVAEKLALLDLEAEAEERRGEWFYIEPLRALRVLERIREEN